MMGGNSCDTPKSIKEFAPLSQRQRVQIALVRVIQQGNAAVIENINLEESARCSLFLILFLYNRSCV